MYRSHSELNRAVADLETKVSELADALAVATSHVTALLEAVQPYPTTPAVTDGTPADEPGKE